jgi:hypothetical protein
MSDIREFLALIQPNVQNADPSLCRLTDWRMTVSLAWVGDEGPNRCVYLDNPGPEIAPNCEKDAVFWSEPWDGTLEALRELKERAEFLRLWRGRPGDYIIIALERNWEALEGNWGETANTVAVFPAFVERIDRTEGNDLNAGLRDWLGRLDAAHARINRLNFD